MNQRNDSQPNTNQDDADRDSSGTRTQTGGERTDMREANDNIRKAQGEDGEDRQDTRPTIDRHR